MTNIISLVQKMVCNFVLLSRPWFSLHLCFFRKPKRSCKNHNFNDQFKLLVVVFLYRASTYRVKKPHNLILLTIPLTKTNSCVRVHKFHSSYT